MTRPNVLVIGAMKSGTRTFYELLRRTDGVAVTLDHEPEVLHASSDEAGARSRYELQFPGRSGHAPVRAEVSTAYAKRPFVEGIVPRARDWLGEDTWIIYLVRDPIDRMRSHVRHRMATGSLSPMSWERVLADHPEVVQFSRYAYQLEPWLDAFGDRVRVIAFDDLIGDTNRCMAAVGDLLGFDAGAVAAGDPPPTMNSASDVRRVPAWLTRITHSAAYRRWLRPLLPAVVLRRGRAAVGEVAGSPLDEFEPQDHADIVDMLAREYDTVLSHPSRLRP